MNKMNATSKIIEEAIIFIEDNIKSKIKLDDIALNCNVSKYHLHRLFKALTGKSLMDYVTSRKLSASVEELLNSNFRIIDIANEYGFDYEQNYIRSFKKVFNQTPLKARNTMQGVRVTEKLSIDEILSVGDAVVSKPQFIIKPAFHITGVKHKMLFSDDIAKANAFGRKFFYNEKNNISNVTKSHIYIGYTDWSTNHYGYNYYIPSVITNKNNIVPEGMVSLLIPNHKYVVFKFIGFFTPDDITVKHIGSILNYMYEKWTYQAGYEFTDTFRFEYIDNSISKDDYCELDIYQPVRKKEI
jgi:AraC family transcriptional regulator